MKEYANSSDFYLCKDIFTHWQIKELWQKVQNIAISVADRNLR